MDYNNILFYIIFISLICGAYFLGKYVCWKVANEKMKEVETELNRLRVQNQHKQ